MQFEEILDIFFSESSELLQRMEATLLSLEDSPNEPKERLDDLFRSIHTIKGSAGIFGMEEIVQFTHHLESVLDLLREGNLTLDKKMISLFLECRDLITELIENIANKRAHSEEILNHKNELSDSLRKILGGEFSSVETPPIDTSAMERATEFIHEETKKQEEKIIPTTPELCWHISIRYKQGTFKHGLDPYSVFKYLEKYGEIKNLFTLHFSIPNFIDLNPEDCFLGFELAYKTDKKYDFILDAFEFVQFDADIKILPPGRTAEDILNFIIERNESPLRLVRIFKYLNGITPEIITNLFSIIRKRKNKSIHDGEEKHSTPKKNIVQEKPAQTPSTNEKEIKKEIPKETPLKIDEVQKKEPEKKETKDEEKSFPPKVEKSQKAQIPKNVSQPSVSTSPPKESKTIRIDSSKLDQLINQVGELVISGANLNQFSTGGNEEELQESIFQLNHLISEIRDTSLNLRMVQIGETFSRFHRVVRDISAELGKEVELKITGGETELDKLVIEKITDPLTHLVRNALDHGIEPKEERVEAGKSSRAILLLNAYHDAGNIVIEVTDDGRGLDKEKIYNKAVERGLIEQGDELSESELFRLIFKPGFSTASKVTNISGRGVGLDVVEKNITSLRGSIELFSEQGKGATIQVRLPLTLAIIDGFLFRVGESYFVVPLDQVVECIEYKQEYMEQDGKDLINLRGKILPFFKLQKLFESLEESKGRKNILVLRLGGREVGLLVDTLHGEFQTVIKPLGKVFKNLKGVSGTTILGSGAVALILDVSMIFQLVTKREQASFK
ncbi:MAG: chemotaxis protein CheA [Leptospiraceae bacterium]|nr:chemotaxis protein CheA [Leptospiraceae bacterium]